jgi:hypothetical protein
MPCETAYGTPAPVEGKPAGAAVYMMYLEPVNAALVEAMRKVPN